MSTVTVVLLCLVGIEVGMFIGWFAFDIYIHRPQINKAKKMLRDVNDVMGVLISSVDSMTDKVKKIRVGGEPQVMEDGSIVSPLQVKRPNDE
jgi:uncharacterized protein YneF (UPF0154 family)